jgi:Rrf2 family iron-sulfur cluster assembly transcriptional regulator
MKITAQEEYGLRILLRIANEGGEEGITISQLSKEEGLSQHYAAKLCRLLRIAGFIKSSRGKEGGYTLALPPDRINLNQVLTLLGGKLYSETFCRSHSGLLKDCSHACSCSVRSIWQILQQAVDEILNGFNLQDLQNLQNGTAEIQPAVLENLTKIMENNLSLREQP